MGKGTRFFVDTVLNVSDVIEETTLMKSRIRADEDNYKRQIMDYYYNDDIQYRRPNAASDVKAFQRKKTNL